MHASKKSRRGVFVGVWIPETLLPVLDRAVVTDDTDRSKFIRIAMREKLQRRTAEVVSR